METIATQRFIGFVALCLVIAGNAAGNILLKLGANAARDSALFGFLNWQTAAGIACFALGIVAYAGALRSLDLHVAQIAVSLQYVAVIVLSALLLGEHVSQDQWFGIALIGIGLVICAR